MTADGADSPEMRDHPSPSDQDLDRLLAGKLAEGADPLDRELAGFAQDVRAVFCVPPGPEVERRHLAAALAASRLTTDNGDPAVRPASNAAGPWWRTAPRASGLPEWRRRTVFSSLFASLTAKILTVALAAAAATGGLAAAGSLPAPAQQAAADVASTIGITLPSPHHEAAVTGTVTGTVQGDHDDHGVSGTVNGDDHEVSGTAHGDDHGVSGTVTSVVNHGNCVSFAAHIASSLGLTGQQKGQFISTVAQNSSAVSAKVAEGGLPDPACQAALVAAKAAVGATAGTTHGHGDDASAVTATATTQGDDQGENSGDQGENHKGDKDDHGVTATVTSPTGSSGSGGSEHGSGHGSSGS